MTPVGFISSPKELAIYELTWGGSGSNRLYVSRYPMLSDRSRR